MFSLWPTSNRRAWAELTAGLADIRKELTAVSAQLNVLQTTLTKGLAQMSGNFANLNQALTLEATEVQQVVATVTQLEQQVAALTAAAGSGDQAAIDAATAALQTSIDSLKAAVSSAQPASPPSGGGTDTTGGGGSTPPASGS